MNRTNVLRLILLAAASVFFIAERAYSQSADIFTTLTGVKNAALVEGKSGLCDFKPSIDKKIAALKYEDKRYAALETFLKAKDSAKQVNVKNALGQTPLYFAIYDGDGPAIVDALLEAGADPNAPLFGRSPVWHALTIDNEYSTYIASTLLDYGADPNAKTSDGETLLHCAASHNNFWVVQRLLENGADPNAKSQGKTPAQLATSKTVKDLFANWGSKPYPYSPLNKDEPKLCKAAARNNYWAVKRLLDAGADKNASWKNKKAADLSTDMRVRQLLGAKGSSKIEFSAFRSGHIFFGEFDRSNRHNSGGHSYSAFLYMRNCNLKPKVHAIFENGVQVCSVERHTEKRTADDPANPRHSIFPTHWTKGDIFEAVNTLALANVDEDKIEENYNGVRIVVILRDNPKGNWRDVITAYPSSVQPMANGRMERVDQARQNVKR